MLRLSSLERKNFGRGITRNRTPSKKTTQITAPENKKRRAIKEQIVIDGERRQGNLRLPNVRKTS
jgi:hypothetical protein